VSKKLGYTGYEYIDLSPWNGPPYSYSVKINGKMRKMMGFDEQHILDQLHPIKPQKIFKKRGTR
jgi:hypothetical protein